MKKRWFRFKYKAHHNNDHWLHYVGISGEHTECSIEPPGDPTISWFSGPGWNWRLV